MSAVREDAKHILLDGLDIDWEITASDIRMFRELWEADANIETIAEELNRKPLEIMLLVVEQAELGYIEQRPQGISGY